ncbi:hypothetical protein PROFUN_01696 [Planoprotostelium fungivorum]|uniref:Uncharacterized protein n=1 Tax=Planoprotostelium fungivorum TaxID=1890364 RepID=A0A2P6MW84_9EUKA|nr:hypothetical protein PROFUN_01696 [Planoprotostelium fungivorum]
MSVSVWEEVVLLCYNMRDISQKAIRGRTVTSDPGCSGSISDRQPGNLMASRRGYNWAVRLQCPNILKVKLFQTSSSNRDQ